MAMKMQGLCPLLQVFDMPAAVRFYGGVLGFEVVSRSPAYAVEEGVELFHWIWMRLGGAELMLNTAYEAGERPEARDGVREAAHGDVTVYFDCDDLEEAYAHLQAQGVRCGRPAMASHGMRELALHDPDGYGIVLHHRV